MTSSINPNNIDGTFPVAGQDNDSQGFRDNFTNIKNNVLYSRDEITDLQNKALLKSSLGPGSSLANNDLNGAVLYRSNLKSYELTFVDLGTISSTSSVSFLDGNMQKLTGGTVSNTLALGLQDFPDSGTCGTLRLWLHTIVGNYNLQLPSTVTLGLNKLSNWTASPSTINFPTAGNFLFEFVTVDGGTNFWIIQLA